MKGNEGEERMKTTLLRFLAAALTGLFLVGAYAAEGDECTTADGKPGMEDASGKCVPTAGE
jgi:hypothetical protein